MNLIHRNPYRILGLQINATDKEIAKRVAELEAPCVRIVVTSPFQINLLLWGHRKGVNNEALFERAERQYHCQAATRHHGNLTVHHTFGSLPEGSPTLSYLDPAGGQGNVRCKG